jgi:hypothetical protein
MFCACLLPLAFIMTEKLSQTKIYVKPYFSPFPGVARNAVRP